LLSVPHLFDPFSTLLCVALQALRGGIPNKTLWVVTETMEAAFLPLECNDFVVKLDFHLRVAHSPVNLECIFVECDERAVGAGRHRGYFQIE
jgi:hypothetical protein